jgi:3-oxoadipate enol-lactonase
VSSVEIQGERFNCCVEGEAGAPTLVLSSSLGTNLAMWDTQMPAFSQRFRVVRYDSRGHGASALTPGPYTIERLARDVIALLDTLSIDRAHFCGLSMGGAVGMWLGANVQERIDRLVLCNTAPKIYSPEVWNTRIDTVRKGGVAVIADAVLKGWFTAPFHERAPQAVARMRAMLTTTPTEGYVACCAALRDMDQWKALATIKRPTLVIAGTHDPATPPAAAKRMVESIEGSRYVELDAAHLSNVEAAAPFTEAVTQFLTQ